MKSSIQNNHPNENNEENIASSPVDKANDILLKIQYPQGRQGSGDSFVHMYGFDRENVNSHQLPYFIKYPQGRFSTTEPRQQGFVQYPQGRYMVAPRQGGFVQQYAPQPSSPFPAVHRVQNSPLPKLNESFSFEFESSNDERDCWDDPKSDSLERW
jgi:hypothetical protein